jgi:hypothetical protein
MKKLREINRPVLLCDGEGDLNPESIGWSRKPLHMCNLDGHSFRKKKWNYWCITTDEFLFSATISNIDYGALAFIYFLEYDTKKYFEKTATLFYPWTRKIVMPESVAQSVQFEHPLMNLHFDVEREGVHIAVDAKDILGRDLRADLHVRVDPDHETLNVVIPWSKERFQFTSKQNCLPTHGLLKWGDQTYEFKKRRSFACLDFGRGVWPYSSSWNWGSFSGVSDGDTIGLNIGGKWTDGTGANENALCVNGKIYKMAHDVVFEYDRRDFMKEWSIKSVGGDEVKLTFKPFFHRVARSNFLVISSNVDQMFGKYYGYIRSKDAKIKIDGITGWAEEHIARW